jgi:hypothetical protein
VNVEGELAVVIGKTSTELTPQNALEHVLGFTCVRAKSGSFNLPSSVVDCLVYVTSWLSAGSGGCPTLLPNAESERGYLVFLQVVRERPVCFPVNGA